MGEVTERRADISRPVPITAQHLTDEFSCGKPSLDDWLRERALRSEGRSARTYVAAARARVVAYYCFAAGSVRLEEAPKPMRRNMPNQLPVLLIGRLAVDTGYQGLGLGKALLKDALLRAVQAASIIGARALMVHALDDEAARFYAERGFVAFPEHSHTFFMPMELVRAAVAQITSR